MALQERVDEYDKATQKFQMALHGAEPSGGAEAGQPIVGNDPTQDLGSEAWQRSLQMNLQLNARRRRN